MGFGNNLSNMNYDNTVKNSLDMYMKEMCHYPLLTEEEEKHYGEMLLNPQKKKLLEFSEVDGYTKVTLNTSVLFNSLCNNPSYSDIINDLILFYSEIKNSSDKAIDMLEKYAIESKKVGRALNSKELYKIFNITTSKVILNEKELLKEIKDFMNYKIAFNKMFDSNLRLVVNIALKYKSNIDLMDLIAEGNLGLIKAIIGFDASLGYKFSTYATTCIKQTIRRYVYNCNSTIRVPEYIGNDIYVFKMKIRKLEQEECRELLPDEIAEKLDMPYNTVLEYLAYMDSDISLDADYSDDGDGLTIKDALPSSDNVEDIVMKKALQEDIDSLLSVLTERERDIVKMRFGLGEYLGDKVTFINISRKYSISTQRATQLFYRALYKMKRSIKIDAKQKAIKDYTYR